MRHVRISLALGLFCLIGAAPAGPAPAPAGERTPPKAEPAREKFARLLLPDGPPKPSARPAARRRGVVVNAFGSTRIIIH